jgi:tRNA pseudouridine55 synthase
MESATPDGLLSIDKPAGITSHAVAERLRKTLRTRRIGHGGTLDPFATGLLLLLVGRATRLLSYLDNEPKLYRATIRFGARTSTDDPEGEVLEEQPPPDREDIQRALPALTGDLMQRPPAFSAKRVNGVRAYTAARRGTPLQLEPVRVSVFEWRIVGWHDAELDVEIQCSGGTYIRALARDLGSATGSAAHLASLRRVRTGRYHVDEAAQLSDAEGGAVTLRPMADIVCHLPEQQLDDVEVRRVVHGQAVRAQVAGEIGALRHGDELVAVATRDGDEWRPKVVLRDAN